MKQYRLKNTIEAPLFVNVNTIGETSDKWDGYRFMACNGGYVYFPTETVEHNTEWFENVENDKYKILDIGWEMRGKNFLFKLIMNKTIGSNKWKAVEEAVELALNTDAALHEIVRRYMWAKKYPYLHGPHEAEYYSSDILNKVARDAFNAAKEKRQFNANTLVDVFETFEDYQNSIDKK